LPKPERQLLVCVNARPPGNPKGSCGEKGSQQLFERLKELLKQRGLDERVMVNRTYCLKHCSRGPVIAVQPDNAWYAGVAQGDLDEICEVHGSGGAPIARLAMPDIPWE
jgi:(2Fe-2S) ferredoxin